MVPKKVLDLEKTYVLIPIILFWNIGSFPWMVPDPKTDVDQHLFIAHIFLVLCQMIKNQIRWKRLCYPKQLEMLHQLWYRPEGRWYRKTEDVKKKNLVKKCFKKSKYYSYRKYSKLLFHRELIVKY
jgi:hypothetical protein